MRLSEQRRILKQYCENNNIVVDWLTVPFKHYLENESDLLKCMLRESDNSLFVHLTYTSYITAYSIVENEDEDEHIPSICECYDNNGRY